MNATGKEVEVREYRPSDRESVRALLRETFHDSGGFDRYDSTNPAGESVRVVALLGGKVLGFNQWVPWLLPTSGSLPVGFQSGASAVSSAARGKGVFARLLAFGEQVAVARGVPYFFGFPNPASFGSFLRAGWLHVSTMHLRVSVFPARGKGSGAAIVGSGAPSFHAWRYSNAGVERVGVETVDGPAEVYLRSSRHRFGTTFKILDVLVGGRRKIELLPSVSRQLPGVGLAYARVSDHPSVSGWKLVRIPRSWSTPVIVKPICDRSPSLERELRATLFSYGDIDAA